MSDHVRSEVNLSFRQVEIDSISGFGVTLPGAGDVSVSALTFMVNAYYDIDLGSSITPYLGAGIGFAYLDVDSDSSAVLIVHDSSTEFGWNIMAGASYAISETIDLSLSYRYLGTLDPKSNFSFPRPPQVDKISIDRSEASIVVNS